jgi:hypothetical protein
VHGPNERGLVRFERKTNLEKKVLLGAEFSLEIDLKKLRNIDSKCNLAHKI